MNFSGMTAPYRVIKADSLELRLKNKKEPDVPKISLVPGQNNRVYESSGW
jgi:hypothetical protein